MHDEVKFLLDSTSKSDKSMDHSWENVSEF